MPDFASAAQVAALRGAAAAIVQAAEPSAEMLSRDYLMTSGDAIRCFFVPDAFDESGGLRRSKQRSVAKIGQALDNLDPAFRRFSHGRRLQRLAHRLGIEEPLIYQSMYIVKQPGDDGVVLWHRDAPTIREKPVAVTTLWFALERMDVGNGCLRVRRGSHRAPRADDEGESLEVESGTVIAFDGLLQHASGPNRRAEPRHAFTLHVVDAREPWPPTNWIPRATALRGFAN